MHDDAASSLTPIRHPAPIKSADLNSKKPPTYAAAQGGVRYSLRGAVKRG